MHSLTNSSKLYLKKKRGCPSLFTPPYPRPLHSLQPTQILAPLQPFSLPHISTLPDKDEPEPEQHELKPEQHEPDYGRDKLNQQCKTSMNGFTENVLKWRTEYMPEKYKTSFAQPSPTQII